MSERILFIWIAVTVYPASALARPEFALKQKTSCVTCHVLPMGGGPRNIYGKTYGSRDYVPAKTSTSDVYYGDFRSEAYFPTQKTSNQPNGLSLMEAAATANVAIQNSESQSELRAVLTVDFGSLEFSPREAVLMWKTGTTDALVPAYILFGKFYVPFGLLTDEHRTYARIQTKTTLLDFEMGVMPTWFIYKDLQFDLAVTNGFQSAGQFTSNDLTYAFTPTLRWNPAELPFFLGTSASYHRSLMEPSPYAISSYTGFSIDRISDNAVPIQLLGEADVARHWNSNNDRISFFYPSSGPPPGFLSSITDAQSLGFYGEFLWDISRRFTLIYKFDYLALNESMGEAGFERHGFGFNWYVMSNALLQSRFEIGHPKSPAFQNTDAKAAQDDVFLNFRVWI